VAIDRAVSATRQGERTRAEILHAFAAFLERRQSEMVHLYLCVRNWLQSDDGQGLTEYALLITFVVLIVMASVALLGDTVSQFYSKIASEVGDPF